VGLGRTPFIGARGNRQPMTPSTPRRPCRPADALDLADRDVSTLYWGERARVWIARALAGAPELGRVADEPLTGLDPGHQLDALALFQTLGRGTQGCGVVLTPHDLSVAARFADRVPGPIGGPHYCGRPRAVSGPYP